MISTAQRFGKGNNMETKPGCWEVLGKGRQDE